MPQLAICVDGQLELFEESHFLDQPWNLAECDALLSEAEFPTDYRVGMAGEIDISDSGQLRTSFIQDLHEQLSLLAEEPGWTVPSLANWLDFKIKHPDIPRSQSSLFMNNVITEIMGSRGVEIDNLARHKFRLVKAVEEKIEQHRREQRKKAYQAMLFSDDATTARDSGNLGWFSWGRMVDAFQEAAWALKAGEISKPVRSSYGWHLIFLQERKPVPQRPYEEAQAGIKSMYFWIMTGTILVGVIVTAVIAYMAYANSGTYW